LISTENLTAFIVETLTIDYSYFLPHMEVVVRKSREYLPADKRDPWRSSIDWEKAKLVPFAEPETDQNYSDEFGYYGEPPNPTFELYQSALTDLLTLSKDQRKEQVDRLIKIYHLWAIDFDTSICEEGALNEAFIDLEQRPAYSADPPIALISFNFLYKPYKVFKKNMPEEIDSIYLGINFYTAFVFYVVRKIEAVEELIKASGVDLSQRPSTDESKENHHNKVNKGEIFVRQDARTYLIDELVPYVDKNDLEGLSDLINGKVVDLPITVNCNQNVLGRIFYKAHESRCIPDFKVSLARWICLRFQRKTDGQIYKLTYSTMLNHLKGVGFPED
jgi:hypothetical protein